MAETRDHYVLVPSAEPGAMLVMGTRARPKLPRATGRPGAAGAHEAMRERFSLDAPYLRPAGLIRGPNGKPVAAIHEFDAPESSWIPQDGLRWLALDGVDPVRLAPPDLVRHVEDWLAIRQGAPVPELRPPWARGGWLEPAAKWIRESAAVAELEPVGDVELRAQWPLSSVLRLETRIGYVYFKAVFSIFVYEPAITVALAERTPELVTEVVSVDEERGWMLMRELPGAELGDAEVTEWTEGLRAMSHIQHSWLGRGPDLIELGVADRTLVALERDLAATGSLDLEPELRARFDAAVPELEALCATLADGALPETLVHGDLHPWNVMRDGDDVRIFDWSDACIAHPLFDLATFLPHTDDASARRAMLEDYFETWADVASSEELHALVELAAPLAQVHHAISYLRILDALEPADRWFFADVLESYLLAAVDLLDELRRARPM